MLYALSGIIRKLDLPQVTVDVGGVQYLASVPYPLYESLVDGEKAMITVYTYVREDRLDLFGFHDRAERSLFAELLNLSGVGPKLGLELCSIPRSMLVTAVQEEDVATLTSIKGIGRKTAEKLLVDLKSLLEKHPEWAILPKTGTKSASMDADAVSALTSLGYDQNAAIDALKKVPATFKRTEDRIKAALRSL